MIVSTRGLVNNQRRCARFEPWPGQRRTVRGSQRDWLVGIRRAKRSLAIVASHVPQ